MRRLGMTALVGLSLIAAVSLSTCGGETTARVCTATIWAQPSRPDAKLAVIGSWNDWYLPGIPLQPSDQAPWWTASIDAGTVPPGEYGYLLLEDGVHRRDEHNPLSTFWTAQHDLEVSLLLMPDCAGPVISVESVTVEDRTMRVAATFVAASDGAALATATAKARDGSSVPVTIADDSLVVEAAGLGRGKHSVVVTIEDTAGRTATARAVGFASPAAPTWDGGLLYQVVTDRFRGDGGAVLDPPETPGSRAGGTLDGITAELERGTFADMGVTGLWISPVYVNPVEAREGRGDGHLYTGYHGYWPLDSRGVDPRIGGDAALDRLIDTAHAQGVRVLLDVVPNHVYEDNPRFAGRSDDAGFHWHEPACVCGLGTCDWGTYIQTCWFTTYLPDVRLEQPAALRLAYEDLIWWAERFDSDGVRVDAVPMMPRAATRRMAHELRRSVAGEPPFLIGEVFTGAGAWGVDVIRYYLGPDGLDSVFNFPLMWVIRDVVAHETAGFAEIEAMLLAVDLATDGSGAVMGQILGNHDTTRFLSEAHGDAGGDPWNDPADAAIDDAVAFARMRTGLALLLTLPGLPVLYYGDELGLAGGNDPDNRRVMPGWDGLMAEQAATLALVKRLGRLRVCSPALRTGGRTAVQVDEDVYAYARGRGQQVVLVLLSRADGARSVTIPGELVASGEFIDVLGGDRFVLGGQDVVVELGPRAARVLVAAAGGCAGD